MKFISQKESVQFIKDGFVSHLYGKINIHDIDKIKIDDNGFSEMIRLKLVMKHGRKFLWVVNNNSRDFGDQNSNVIAFRGFLEAFQLQLDEMDLGKTLTNNTSSSHTQTNILTPKNPAEQLVSESQKIDTSKKWVIPVSFVFALLALARACGPEIVKNFRNDPDFSKMYHETKQRETEKIDLALEKADSIFHAFGKVYMLTNDKSADLIGFPIIEDDYEMIANSSDFVKTSQMNEKLDVYLQKADSIGIVFCIKKGSSYRQSIILDPSAKPLFSDSSDSPLMLFAAQDTSLHIVPILERRKDVEKDSSQYPIFSYVNSFAVNPKKKMKENLQNIAPGAQMMFANVRMRPSFKIYFVGDQSRGVTKEMFQKIKNEIHMFNIDTTSFVLKEWN
ncbi:MAG: hypothetical protein DI598_01460 [Pseudopedobacter saltans]|uniref:Uncharacterized protein n=1 Tax=Pseudopedobacter saltans TaxID=151895 RepID=A0A2W5F835_9SPHI|nr:MAG: hypothetical protein DI598_01460 [Pseudopedobacter saltans]